jgi:4-hydroxybenzoate polyprenyltransferase
MMRGPRFRGTHVPAAPSAIVQLLRPHQWLKNLLVFVPVLTAHRWADAAAVRDAALAFAALCALASSVYVLNDRLDFHEDRAHPDKSGRPLAVGALPLGVVWWLLPPLLLIAGALAWTLPRAAVYGLGTYALLALAYALGLKRVIWLDVVVLAALHVLRVVVGGLATGIEISAWLLGFALFMFVGLAAMKRYAEMVRRGLGTPYRAYGGTDHTALLALGGAASMVSVLVLAQYLNSAAVRSLYTHERMLWLCCPVLIYWLGRLWTLSARGVVRSDPLLFAVRDGASWACAVAMAVAIVLAL